MASNPIFNLFFGLVLSCAQPQAVDSTLPGQLPELLNEMEKQLILKERDPRPRVELVLKVAETRIKNAIQLSQENDLRTAARELDAFLSLIVYADTYARQSLASKNKDRNHCLKKIEQIVFKQSRSLESITRAMPIEVRETVESQIGEVKKIRLRAINDLLGGGQVINSSN